MTKRYDDLAGKIILVTGASSGIGAATALALGNAGAKVILTARRKDAIDSLAGQIVKAGGSALAVAADVTDEAALAAVVKAGNDHFGGLDGAFNNAGYFEPGAPLHEQPTAEFLKSLTVNLTGVFWSMKYEIPALLARGGGAIVNNASMIATAAFPGFGAYTAAKSGVVGLTRSAALDYARQGIRINAVSPGLIATAMSAAGFGSAEDRDAFATTTTFGRAGRVDEIANAVLFLLSSQSSFVVGHDLVVDGAYTVS